ncbi:hypothetical protein TNCV_3500481 [Trichonephila clavipes]|nr:hypothetical protein TNCV_3500481 [Trichonephila clavipes]
MSVLMRQKAFYCEVVLKQVFESTWTSLESHKEFDVRSPVPSVDGNARISAATKRIRDMPESSRTWVRDFKNGRTDVIIARAGRPSASDETIAKVEAAMLEDRRTTVRELCEKIPEVSKTTIDHN